MIEEVTSAIAQFKALIREVCKENAVSTSGWLGLLDKAIQLCQSLPEVSPSELNRGTLLSELETSAVSLWNFSVALKTKGTTSAASNAKIRHVAFFTLCFYGEICDEQNDTHWKRQIMMGLKTGRAWLDCGQPEMADRVFVKTERSIERLQRNVAEKISSQPGLSSDVLEKQKLEVEQDMFTLLCYRAESGVLQNRSEESLELVRTAKQLLQKFPKEGPFLSMLCYNLGVELYQRKLFQETIAWMRESFDLGKNKQAVGARNQARTLRLLANANLELDPEKNLQNALNAVSLANTEHAHPAGLFLRLKILLLKKETDETIKQGAGEMLKIPELSVDLCLHVLQTVNHFNRIDLVTWLIEEMLKKFEHSPDIGKLLVTNVEVLLQADMTAEAKEFMEYCITAHHTGRPLDFTIKKRFHMILWEQAAKAFETENHKEALDWYNYSLSLYNQSDTGDLNLAKLHRNRANCYLTLGELGKAKEAVSQSEKCDPSNTHTQFILFKLALQENDDTKACESLKKLCEVGRNEQDGSDSSSICGLVALAAQQALESDKVDTASVALEFLCNTSSDAEQVLTALRCLIRLKLANADKHSENRYAAFSIVNYIQMGYNKLLQIQDTHSDKDINVQSEASWFMKIAWNLALQCDDQPERMKELYILCSQLLALGPSDDSTLSRQMTCMLMSAAACLQVARTTNDETQRKLVLEETLEHLASCRQLCGRLQQLSLSVSDGKAKETEVLLLLYEFEALIKLRDSRVEALLEKALTLPSSDPKTFETMAAIAIEPPACSKSVAVRTLKVAIRKHLQHQQPDIIKCSKLFHSLIQMCLTGSSSHDFSGKEEAWNYYMEIFDVIEKRAQGQYPEMEIVSLMTKAWNCGINFYSTGNYKEAEKWCGMSMRMLKFLATLKASYEDHMNTIYAEVLAKLEGGNKDRPSLEF